MTKPVGAHFRLHACVATEELSSRGALGSTRRSTQELFDLGTDPKSSQAVEFKNGHLKSLTVREFARGSSLTGGPGMVNCSCGKTGKCTNCKCAKAGRRCNSNCSCSRFSMCTNMEEMEAVDKAVLEVDEMNVALTRSELASK